MTISTAPAPTLAVLFLKAILANRMIALVALLFAVTELYNLGLLPAYVTQQQAREAKARADNAFIRQQSEADLAEQKAAIEAETARNAAVFRSAEARAKAEEAELTRQKGITARALADNAERKQRADAAKARAEAEKTAAEAVVARELARNAAVREQGQAQLKSAEADLYEQQAIVKREMDLQAGRLAKAEADNAQIAAAVAKIGKLIVQGRVKSCVFCFPPD